MWIHTLKARLALEAHRAARLDHAFGATLKGRCGTAWITIDGDPRDIVLEPGEHFVVDSAQPVLLLSLIGDAVVDVLEPASPVRPARRRDGWAPRLLAALRRGPSPGYTTRIASYDVRAFLRPLDSELR